MDVSFVITLYNKADYLPHVCRGLETQPENLKIEFIFVDDGSTDDTLAVLAQELTKWPAEWRVHIIRQKNQGPTAALNAGLAAAAGEWIKPLDGDDVLLPGATQHLLWAARQSHADVVYAPMSLQGRYDHRAPPAALPVPPRGECRLVPDMLRQSFRRAQTNPSVLLFRRALIRPGGCNPNVFIQDYSLELALAQRGVWAALNMPVMAMPAELEGRLSVNEAQTLHDVNLALLDFLTAHKNTLPKSLYHYGLARAASRAWRWRRHTAALHKTGMSFLFYVLAKLHWLNLNHAVADELCAPFRASHPIRHAGARG